MAVEPVQVTIVSGTVPRRAPLAARCAKSLQRGAILDCEARLLQAQYDTPAMTAQRSRTHCRGLVAIGRVSGPDWHIGIDIEYADPRRNWPEIVKVFAPGLDIATEPGRGAALWAFGEAYFKAAGALPGESLLRRVAADLPAGARQVQMRIAQDDGRMLHVAGEQCAQATEFWLFVVLMAPDATRAPPRIERLDGR